MKSLVSHCRKAGPLLFLLSLIHAACAPISADKADAGSAIVSDAGLAIVSDAGLAIVSDAGLAIVSDAGLAIVSDAGSAIVSDAGSAIVSDAGSAIVSDAGSAIVSDAGSAIVSDAGSALDAGGAFVDLPLQKTITKVQPMTGIVLWAESWNEHLLKTQPGMIQLEYAYLPVNSVVMGPNVYDWVMLDAMLDDVASRGHQAILRPYYVYPGAESSVPDYLKALPDYQNIEGQSEGQTTGFADWSHAGLRQAHLDFFTAFAAKYDDDVRVAFLQTGFGLWGEYHIYDGPNQLGAQFPSKEFQAEFLQHMNGVFSELTWSLSIDAGSDEYSPLAANDTLRALPFGLFDDSFMHEQHNLYNEEMWTLLGFETRYENSPHGGEFSYYRNFDQEHVLDVTGLYGRVFSDMAVRFHISYMLGNDQPEYQSDARIVQASLETGYRFKVTQWEASEHFVRGTIRNVGVAPAYIDVFPALNGLRVNENLRGLLPEQERSFSWPRPENGLVLSLEADRLVEGQKIEFEASLDGE